jgi:hypothetical protein
MAMKLGSLLIAGCLGGVLLGPARYAQAAEVKPPASAATVLALIVTNNRGPTLERPELRYADDDGAKYYELFDTLGEQNQIELLTEFDADTRQLFPELSPVAKAPTRANVESALQTLGERAQREHAQGRRVEFYFVFAGHGDVDHGKGFVELSDGRFTADDLERALGSVPADASHVLVDSCNSFFLVNARKPGGKRFATPLDASERLARRLPNVGVFVSTSAEAEVYEWSALQSGIFSHAVRSGLSGAADVDHDGRVSYRELQAFVSTAAAKVKNPLFRPQVFASPPGGDFKAPIFDIDASTGARVRVDGDDAHRLTFLDEHDIPRIDLHNEAHAPVTVIVPASWRAGASVEQRLVTADQAPIQRRYLLDPEGRGSAAEETAGAAASPSSSAQPAPAQPLALASLTVVEPRGGGRGPDQLFQNLFAAPFGPVALAKFNQTLETEPPPVFGANREQEARLALVLDQMADLEGQNVLRGRILSAAGLAAFGTVGTLALLDEQRTQAAVSYGFAAAGAVGLIGLGTPDEARALRDRYRTSIAGAKTPAERAQVLFEVEKAMQEQADSAERVRSRLRWPIGLAMGATTAFLVRNELQDDKTTADRYQNRMLFALGTLYLGAAFTSTFFQDPVERIADLWKADPSHFSDATASLPSLQVAIAPAPGGGSIGLLGSF